MIRFLRDAGLLWPLLCVIVALPILIALGNWQWSRMYWKQGLLQDLQRAAAAAPVPLSDLHSAPSSSPAADWGAKRFRRVVVKGRFDHGRELHVWSPQQSGPAWSVVTPLRLQLGATPPLLSGMTHVLVIRGVVPAASKATALRQGGQVGGILSLVGRIRVDRPNRWASEPNTEKNEWFTRDLAAMTAHLRSGDGAIGRVLPVFIEAEQQIGGKSAPKPDLQALTLSNRHLEYAMTWWGLAATLAGVFVAFAWGRLTSTKT